MQQLCCLMLIGPLAAPVEAWLIERSRTSLHYSLQVYWFCQVGEPPRGPRTLWTLPGALLDARPPRCGMLERASAL
mgnify:CR=1 FL=1